MVKTLSLFTVSAKMYNVPEQQSCVECRVANPTTAPGTTLLQNGANY